MRKRKDDGPARPADVRLDPSVIGEVDRTFSPEDARYVLSRLSTLAPDPFGRPLGPRIQIALIWLSGGDPGKFERALKEAYIDWRDTLVAAGLGCDDWRAVLKARGISCDHW